MTLTLQERPTRAELKRMTDLILACSTSKYRKDLKVEGATAALSDGAGNCIARIWWDNGWRHSYLCMRKEGFVSPLEAINEANEAFEVTVRDFLQGDLYAYRYLDEDIQASVKAAAERVMTAPI